MRALRASFALFLLGLPTAAAGQAIFARGDANCSGAINAADLIAVALAEDGAGACGNADCDRSERTDASDRECTAGCLFGDCPVPEHAPQIANIVAVSAPRVVPFSAVRLTGSGFGSPDRLTRVVIGGIEAEVVAVESDGGGAGGASAFVEAIVPGGIPSGPAHAIVLEGDVAGPPMPITIEVAAPVGESDTFDGTMELLDTAVAKLAALDIEGAFGENAEPLAEALQRFRDDLALRRAELAADSNVTPTMRAALDAAFDASGVPEMLIGLIAEIDEAAAGSGGGAGAVTAAVGAFRRGAQTIRIVKGVAAAAGTVIAVPSAPILAGISFIAGVATGVIVAAVSSGSGTPFITDVSFDTALGPRAGSIVTVSGRRLGTNLRLYLRTQSPGLIATDLVSANSFEATFRLGDRLCGPFDFDVGTDAMPRLFTIRSGIVPELLRLFPSMEKAGGRVVAETRGIEGCGGSVEFRRDRNVFGSDFSAWLRPIEGQRDFDLLLPQTANPRAYVADARTDRYGADFVPFEVLLALTGFRVRCAPTELDIEPATPSSSVCTAIPMPLEAAFPTGGTFTWTSSPPGVASLSRGDSMITVRSLTPGQAVIGATFAVGNHRIEGQNTVTLNVQDRTGPTVSISSGSTSREVKAGGLISVQAEATDNLGVRRIVLHASGDAVEGDQEFDCGGQKSCSTAFAVHAKNVELDSRRITLRADAFDVTGLQRGSDSLVFTVSVDGECPEVQIQSPADGATVRAGDMVQISALVTDNRQDDTGVRRVRVNATGDAVESPPLPAEATLPMPLPRVTRLATFRVKDAAALAGIANRSIVISASAADDAGNSCEAQTVTVTAGGPPRIAAAGPSPVGAGRDVTITGSGFGEAQGSSSVTVGGLPAAVVSWSNAAIRATVPGSLSGMHPVVVTVDGQASNAFPIQVLGTGDIQITLAWSDSNDLDLHVTEPSGETINYINTQSESGGRLDADANAGCSGGAGAGRENVFWPSGQAPAGPYQVRVVYFRGCTEEPMPSSGVRVTATVDGRFMVLLDNVTVPIGGSVVASFTRGAPH